LFITHVFAGFYMLYLAPLKQSQFDKQQYLFMYLLTTAD
jgi:hypothetical protein